MNKDQFPKNRRKSLAAFIVLGILLMCGLTYYYLRPAKRPNVVILLLDTLRADHLGTYGYERNTSPNLDAFAREYNKCDYAVPAAPWTPPSVASILSGMYVGSHGLMPPNGRSEAKTSKVILNSNIETLAEVLKANGYLTAGVSSNPWVTKEFGYDQGFDSFTFRSRVTASRITNEGKRIIERHKADDKPMFLYLHYLDPHDPYSQPGEFATKYSDALKTGNYPPEVQKLINSYDGEISFLDSEIGKLFSFMKEKGVFENSIIIVVGDHGEQFGEHGFFTHGFQVFNTEAHVPLLFKLGSGGIKGTTIKTTVSTVDIYSTILSALGIKVPKQASLSIPLTDSAGQAARPGVFTEISRKLSQRSFTASNGRKLILGDKEPGATTSADRPTTEIVGVYDRFTDYKELSPLNVPEDEVQELQENWQKLYKAILALRPEQSNSEVKVSDDTLGQLESLGYLK